MPITTFENSYARYLLTLPKHVIEQYSEEELSTADWFNHPDVVSGPFIVTDFDVDHYISYEANKDYWKGAPKIDKLNIKIVDGSQLYAGLQSGEIDITQQTMSDIPQEDYESVEALDNVEVVYGSPVTNQSVFIQTKNVPDVKVRQAMLYAIDRQQILEELLNGHGEIVDGFLSSASPFYDDSLTPISYDPEKAKALLEETGCDGVMIGRAAQGNPWIFAQTAEYLEHGTVPKKPELSEVKEMIRRHAGLQMKYKSELTAMREMRKHVAWYTAGYPHSAQLRAAVNEVQSMEELEQLLEGWN